MYLSSFISLVLPLAAASGPQHIFSNPVNISADFRIPSSYKSAVMARRILRLTPIGTLSTVFPSSSALENRPDHLGGTPIGLMDYVADCESSGNPTILAINIATSFKNVAAGSNITLSMQWAPPYPPKSRIESRFNIPFFSSWGNKNEPEPLPYSAANLPRFSLLGYLEKIKDKEVEAQKLGKCFTGVHPDAKYWLPGNAIHTSEWIRLVVTQVYWIGGFGDRAYIGWIPVEEWQNVTSKEWKDIRLPGEQKGWKEWSMEL